MKYINKDTKLKFVHSRPHTNARKSIILTTLGQYLSSTPHITHQIQSPPPKKKKKREASAPPHLFCSSDKV